MMQGKEETKAEELVLVLTTEGSLEKAEKLASVLLEQGLVACVSLVPIVSHYLWEGRTMRSQEVQLLLKTNPASLETLYGTVMGHHSYDTPEWISLRAQTRGAYGEWCTEQLARGGFKAGDGPPAPARSHGDGDRAG